MEFTDVVRSRRMVRRYDPTRPVSRETVGALLDLATRAPSAGFSQGWQFLVLDSRADLDLYWTLTSPSGPDDAWLRGMRTAPVLLLVLSDPDRYAARYAEPDKTGSSLTADDPWPVPWWDVDSAMAALLTLLAAVDIGLAGCLAGVPATRWGAVRDAFGIPARLRLLGIVTLGHPAADTTPRTPRQRRPAAELVSWSRYTGS